MKKIMVLGASDFQIPIIKKCRAMGLETFVVDYDKDAVGFSLADHRFILSTTDESAVLDLARKCKINAIITNSDYPVRTLAKVCEEMFLPGPSCHSAKLATNKYQQRKILSDNGFATPKFTDFRSLNDLKSASKNMTYPLIVKPVDSSASRGVSKVSTQEQLLSVCLSTLSYSREKLGIIEEFISGPEFSVEVLVQDNVAHVIAITEKTTC